MNTELIIDNFAGGGGTSTGIEMALGRSPDIAINHDLEAVAMHRANHPQTRHFCEDVWDVDPMEATGGEPVGLAWFSPDCKHFSKAKGGKPVSKKIRGLAWVAVRWAAKVRPRVIILENVEEFKTWGPLRNGQPCPKNKGRIFAAFVNRLKRLGYAVEWKELRACDYGAPTIRKRLFLIARCDGRPIVWPEPMHGQPDSEMVREGKLLPYLSAGSCIDWSITCPSIFERKKPLAEATCRRVAKGVMRYVVEAGSPFIVNTANTKTTGRGPNNWDIDEPLRTVTASTGMALVAPTLIECANTSNERAMKADEPLRTQCAEVKGGHFALVTAFLAKHYTGVVGADLEDPMPTVTAVDHNSLVAATLTRQFGQSGAADAHSPLGTITAGGQGKQQLVSAHLCKMRGDNVGDAVDAPLHTISAGGLHHALVYSFLTKYYGSGESSQALNEPMHTVTARDRFNVVCVVVDGVTYAIADIGLRMLQPRELFRAQGFPEHYVIDRGHYPLFGSEVEVRYMTKTAQVRMCGNSVCPPLAQALVSANVPEMAITQERRSIA